MPRRFRPGSDKEYALAGRRVQHGRVERHLTARIDRRDNRLRSDIERVEAAGRRHTRPDHAEGQAAIGAFELSGEPLFDPSAAAPK